MFADIPLLTKLKKKVSELNQQWNIVPTPNGTNGIQQSLRERLLRIRHMFQIAPEDAPFSYVHCMLLLVPY